MNLMKEKVFVLKVMLVDHNMICSLRIEKKCVVCHSEMKTTTT